MKLTIYSFIYLFFFASISLTGQVMNRQEIEKGTGIKRNALYNLEEIKVRWKKAALENCPGVPCVTSTVPGAPTNVVATTGNTTASVAFTAPTNNGGSVITGYTVRSNPGNITATGSTSPITVTGLTNGTAYTFTVVATNAVGNSAPSAASTLVTPGPPPFTCGTSTVSDIDGNAYNTVLIGTQCWTKENLKVTKYNNNDPIPDNTNSWNTNPTGARTEYVASGVTGYVGNYGYLYNWYAVNDSRNICPAGWHVPTLPEWLLLETTLGINTAAPKLKSTSSLWNSGLVANNSSGFSALPGGFRYGNGNFGDIRDAFYIWTNTTNSSNNSLAEKRYIYRSDNTNVANWSNQSKAAATSVRCLKD
jgi:uncharacterized protein (TIGR02145 family)